MKQTSAAGRDEVEEAGILLEEPPPLRKEQRKAIERDLLLVGLHLREVGVRRQVEREVRREGIARVDADLADRRLAPAERRVGRRRASTYGVR